MQKDNFEKHNTNKTFGNVKFKTTWGSLEKDWLAKMDDWGKLQVGFDCRKAVWKNLKKRRVEECPVFQQNRALFALIRRNFGT